MGLRDAKRNLTNIQGGNLRDYYVNTSKKTLLDSFADHPSYYDVLVNGENYGARISNEKKANQFTTYQSDQLTFLFPSDTQLDMGDVVTLKNKSYILYDENESEIYPAYYSIKINGSIKLQTGVEKVQTGTDRAGRPINEETPIYADYPCFIAVNARNNEFTELGGRINPIAGRMTVLLPHVENRRFREAMYIYYRDERYQIITVDESRATEDKGVYSLIIDKVAEKKT